MTAGIDDDAREISVQELLGQLSRGTKLTLIFRSARGQLCRGHRTVQRVGKKVVRMKTVPRDENEPVVRIVFVRGDRVFLLSDGFVLVSASGIPARYAWGHV